MTTVQNKEDTSEEVKKAVDVVSERLDKFEQHGNKKLKDAFKMKWEEHLKTLEKLKEGILPESLKSMVQRKKSGDVEMGGEGQEGGASGKEQGTTRKQTEENKEEPVKEQEEGQRKEDETREKDFFEEMVENQKKMLADLAVAATRPLDAWDIDEKNQFKFSDWASDSYVGRMNELISNGLSAFESALSPVKPTTVELIDRRAQRDLIEEAKNLVRERMDLVNSIRPSTGKDEFEQFLEDVDFFKFGGSLSDNLRGLSSPWGNRLYISDRLLRERADERAYDMDLAAKTMAHELMQNWARWRQPSVFYPLRSLSGDLIGPGDFFEERAFDRLLRNPQPFSINEVMRPMLSNY